MGLDIKLARTAPCVVSTEGKAGNGLLVTFVSVFSPCSPHITYVPHVSAEVRVEKCRAEGGGEDSSV